MSIESIFITPQNSETCIDLIDASGSTIEMMGSIQVFDKERDICKSLSHSEHRIVFWNSNRNGNTTFDMSGAFKWPTPIVNGKLDTIFNSIKSMITPNCLTMPHLGFRAIDDWLKANYSSVINFITDGEIGWGSAAHYVKLGLIQDLVDAIKYINKTYPDVQINIFAVERESLVDYSIAESMNGVVGNDVYSAISNNGLTSMISKFITFSRKHPDGHIHINKVKTPIGFVPYGSAYFSILNTVRFITHISEQVALNKDSEFNLLKIIQDLSVSINVLTKDKPKMIREKTVNIFRNMFSNTTIDLSIVQVLLTRAIEAESAGSAQLHSDYRANLRTLYADADRALRTNVATAISLNERTISLPMQTSTGNVIFLTYKTPNRSVLGYFNGGMDINGKIIPILPISYKSSVFVGQCIRQWIRLLISKIYHINATSDEVIFIMMMINLQAKVMKLDSVVCNAYTMLVGVLLEKKRANIQISELDNLLKGNLFVPNDGNIANFKIYIDNTVKQSGMFENATTLKMWYYMCQAYSQELADSQYIHCKHELSENPTFREYETLVVRPWAVHNISEELEYHCVVTMNSTAETGGFRIKSHPIANSVCDPKHVFSKEGMECILAKPMTSLCHICYTPINNDWFVEVPKYNPANASIDISTLGNIFGDAPAPAISSSSSSSSSSTNVIVFLKGTVGCGKSTYAKKMQKLAQDAGYDCIIEGTDQYVIQGNNIKNAIATIKRNLSGIQRKPGNKKMVIIDTCGERSNQRDVFGVDFSSWSVRNVLVNYDIAQQDKYLSWSLRNVLRREPGGAVLTVGKTSLPVCIDVHFKKASSLFNNVRPISGTILNELIERLTPDADAYNKYLEMNANIYEPSL